MSTKTVNIQGLSRAAIEYGNYLRTLPYFALLEEAKKLLINIYEVNGKHTLINKRRKADILRPYRPGLTLGQEKELMKFFEASLEPERVYAEIVDNITNYSDVKVISNAGEPVDNKTKKHPLEVLILQSVVLSFAEDVLFNLFHAERDEDTKSAATSFNGFFYKLNTLIAASEITAAKGNYTNTGAFGASGDTDYERMVDFLKSADPLLRRDKVVLYAGEKPMNAVRDSFRHIVGSHDYPTLEQVIVKLRGDANIPALQVVTSVAYGVGDQLMLTKPGNLDLGVGNKSDAQFVKVRDPYEDPNEVQFWIQAEYDTRIQDVHRKVLLVNEQKNASLNLAGDY